MTFWDYADRHPFVVAIFGGFGVFITLVIICGTFLFIDVHMTQRSIERATDRAAKKDKGQQA